MADGKNDRRRNRHNACKGSCGADGLCVEIIKAFQRAGTLANSHYSFLSIISPFGASLARPLIAILEGK